MAIPGTRLLIATGEAAASEDELPPFVRALIDTASEMLVMTPVLVSRLSGWRPTPTGRGTRPTSVVDVLGQVDTLAPEAGSAAGSATRRR